MGVRNYDIQGKSGAIKLKVDASIGLAEHALGELLKDLLARADGAMYEHKRHRGGGPGGIALVSCLRIGLTKTRTVFL